MFCLLFSASFIQHLMFDHFEVLVCYMKIVLIWFFTNNQAIRHVDQLVFLYSITLYLDKKHMKIMVPYPLTLKSRIGHYSGLDLSGHASPADWARVVQTFYGFSKSFSSDFKKKFFVLGWGFLGVMSQWGRVFTFLASLPGPGRQPIEPFFWFNFFWKLGQNARL